MGSLIAKIVGNPNGLGYNGVWHLYWDEQSVASGNFNERMLAWLNARLSASYTNLPQAQQAYAESKSANNWDSLGDLGLP